MVRGLIIEGIAGAEKTTIFKSLQTHDGFLKYAPKISVFEEEKTLGNLVPELRDSKMSDLDRCDRLWSVLQIVEAKLERGDFVVLERFHHSYYALMPRWELVEQIDKIICDLDFACVFLDYLPSFVEERFFYRPEMHNDGWTTGLEEWYGSKQAAIEACLESKSNRLKSLKLSNIPTLKLNTMNKDWGKFCDKIVDFLKRD
jgi:hypothetical protein